MKLLLLLMLLPLGYFVGGSPEPVQTSEEFIYELTVNSLDVDSIKFNLSVTGFTLTETGTKTPFQFEKQNLKTPYKLILKNGSYKAIVENVAKDAVIISKVQGIKDGERMGYGSGEAMRILLHFGFGGKYSVIEE